MSRPIDSNKRARWAMHLRHYAASGLSARDFCFRHALNANSFYWWRRRLAAPQTPGLQTPPSGRPLFVPVRVSEPQRRAPDDVTVASGDRCASAPTGRIDVRLSGGVTVRLHGSVPPQRLAEVLAVLDRRGGGKC